MTTSRDSGKELNDSPHPLKGAEAACKVPGYRRHPTSEHHPSAEHHHTRPMAKGATPGPSTPPGVTHLADHPPPWTHPPLKDQTSTPVAFKINPRLFKCLNVKNAKRVHEHTQN